MSKDNGCFGNRSTRQIISLRSFHHVGLTRKLVFVLALSLLVPSGLLGQALQNKALASADQTPGAAAPAGGQRAVKPELVLQSGVTAPAALMAFSPNGQLLASMSIYGGTIDLWEVATGRELITIDLGAHSMQTIARASAFCFSPDGASLLTISSNQFKQWDVRTGRELRAVNLSIGEDVGRALFSPDARYFVTNTLAQKSLIVWDAATGQQVQSLKFGLDDPHYIYAAAFSLDGQTLATIEGSHRGAGTISLLLRDMTSWRVKQTTTIHEDKRGIGAQIDVLPRGLRFTPDGRAIGALLDTFSSPLAQPVRINQHTADRESAVKLWDTTTGRELRSFNIASVRGESTNQHRVDFLPSASEFAFTPDGKQFAVIEGQTVNLVDIASGNITAMLSGHGAEVIALTLTADGRQGATACVDSTIKIWEVASGRATISRTLSAGALPVNGLAFADDGRSLVTSSAQAVNLWEMTTGASVRTIELPQAVNTILAQIMQLPPRPYINPGGQLIAANGGVGTIKLWETRTGREVRSVTLPDGKGAGSATISPDGSLIAVVEAREMGNASSQTPQPGTTPTATPTPTAPPVPAPPTQDPNAKKKDDKQKAKDARKQMQEMQRDMMKQMEQMTKSGKTPTMPSMPDPAQMQQVIDAVQRGDIGKAQEMAGQVLGGSSSPFVSAMLPTTPSVRLFDVKAGSEVRVFAGQPIYGAPNDPEVAFSPDGRVIASATGGSSIRLNDFRSGSEVLKITPDRAMHVNALAFSSDGRILATGLMETAPGFNSTSASQGLNFSKFLNFTVRLWDVSNPSAGARELKSFVGHSGQMRAMAFSPDGRTLATGSFDTTIKLWDVESGRELKTLAGHSITINALSFSPDGKYLASGSADGSAKLWDAQTGQVLVTLATMNGGADWLAITPDGLFDGTPAAWSQILWRFSPNIFDVAPVEIFFNEFFYPGLLTDIYSGKRPKAAQDVSEKDRRQPVVSLARTDGQPTGASVASRTIKVRINVAEPASANASSPPAGARDVRLFRNGTLIKVWRGDVLNGQKQVALEATLPIVAGENRLTAYGFNRDNVKSADATLAVVGAPELQRKGTAYVLTVGVNRYANEQYNLKYAVADATAFADEVSSDQMKLKNYERVEIIQLADKDATKENILLALKRFSNSINLPANTPAALAKIQPAQPEDAVIIYFAGHGTVAGARFYLVPHDLGYTGSRTGIDQKAVDTILAHSISDLELESAVEGLDAGQMLFVIDACNSGQALEAEEKRRGPMNSKGLAQLAYEKGISILTAAQSYQAALEASQLGHGYLTYALIEEGLKQGAADKDRKDGQILTREWFNYASERVPQMQEQKTGTRLLLEDDKNSSLTRSVQRPRAFYRRESESHPLIVAKP